DIMREELAESRKRELELQKKEKELVASLSHDLKTPITGIKLTADFMAARLQAWTQPEQKEHTISDEELTDMLSDAVKIAQKTEQIDTLVTDLFNSTLDELGEIRVVCADEAASVLGELVQDFDNKDKVVMEAIPEVIISIDRKRMTQVIGNIISNSYKYADTRIDISYEIIEGYLEMNIRDYGPGVPANELDLITNKFYRGKDWIDKDKDGNGLGLYIAKTLMNKMKGDLITESPGEGLEVKLVIPLS
ncbi:MAG: HAMP domain-containing histidine kinase, partial [Eubacterium sp.]|nr:HAMP domain-containing histidine kinase [Eubacterium sp.]